MNKERLLAAFGEIDDKIFGEHWEVSPEKAEDNTIEPVFTSVKDKKRRKPLIIAASAVAACGVFAAGLGIALNIDRPPTDTDVRIYDSSEIFPDIEFADDYKSIYNAEDLYQVETIEVDPDIATKYRSLPSLVDGKKVYFSTDAHSANAYAGIPPQAAYIIAYDTETGEEKTIYSGPKRWEDSDLRLDTVGIYNSYLYFKREEYKKGEEEASEICRVNLNDGGFEVIFSARHPLNSRFVLSKGDNCLYFGYSDTSALEDTLNVIYRYDTESGKTEKFMENAYVQAAYKNGLIYRTKDSEFYYHNPADPNSDIALTDNKISVNKNADADNTDGSIVRMPESYGESFFLYQDIDTGIGGKDIIWDVGVEDENGDRPLFAGKGIVLARNSYGTNDGLVIIQGNPGRDKPLIYDYKNDIFSFVDIDPINYYVFSPLGFNSNESVCVRTHHAENSQYESVTITTITRKPDPVVTLPDNSKTLFPDLEFAEGYKNISNAEDLYRVKRMEIDADIINKYGELPSLIDGDKVYFTTRIEPFYHYTQTLHTDPLKTAEIILYDNYTKEEKVIYSHDKQRDNYMLFLDLLGIRGGYLYFYQTESGDGGGYGYTDFCRLNLSDLTSEVIYSSYNGAPHSYPAVSEGDNSLYLWFNEYNGGDFGVPRLYRYDIKSGKTELFMEGVSECYTYLDGIMYKKDGNIYYHSPIVDEDAILCPDKYTEVKSFGLDSRFYIRSSEDNDSKVFGIGNRDGERDLITGTSLYLSNAVGGRYGLIGFSHMGKPMIYDYIEDRFVYIDADKDCFAFSPLGFEDSGCAAFFEHSGTEKGYTSCELITVTRSSDNIALTEHEEENLLSGYELYTGGNSGEILNAEDLYHVNKEEIYRHIATVNSLTPFESAGALESIYVNRFYGGGRVYLEGTDFYFTTDKSGKTPDKPDYEKTPAQILLYDTQQSGGITVIAEEMPEEEEWGLMLKIAGIFDGYMYYYKTERPKGYIDEENINSLWRVNLQDGKKEKISDIKYDWYLDLDPMVKAGDYIYFTDYGKANDNSPEIYRFNTRTNTTELFKDNVQSPVICSCKDGIIYYSPESYYTYEENGKAHTLCPSDYTGKIDTFGDNIMYAHRIWEDNEQKTVLGIFDENLTQKELGVFPTGAVKDSQSPTEVYGAGEVNENFTAGGSGLAYVSIQFGNNILLYDKDKDCFSQIVLSEGEEVVCCSETEKGLAFITAKSGEGIAGYDYNDYEFVRRITLSR